MVELKSFIKALKISWLRRILQQSDASSWKDLSFINCSQLFSVGGCYAAKLSSDLQNPFWKDLLHVWAEFCNILPVENIGQILESPLWYNENIGRGNFILKNWYANGIRVVYDIVAKNGEFYTFEQLKVMYNIRGTFLDYQRMLNNISQSWKAQIYDNRVFILENKHNVLCNIYVKKLIKAKKGSTIFYDTFVGVNEYIPQGKWQAEMGDISENEWKLYFLNIKQWHEIKLRDFQYKINNKKSPGYKFFFV